MANFQEAKEQMGTTIRWTEQPKNAEDKSIYLGSVIQGFYKNKKEGVGQNESNIYEIQLLDGTLVGIWGSGVLDGKFAEIPTGCEVRITCLGIAQPKSPKGRAYMNFTVEYDKSSRMPLTPAGDAPVSTPVAPAAYATSTPPVAPTAPVAPTVPPAAPSAGDGY